jgi:hypothetical protein
MNNKNINSDFNVFDHKTYINNYSDLKSNNFFNNKLGAWIHWIKYGKKEGRTFYKIDYDGTESKNNSEIINDKQNVIIISNIQGGGSLKYIRDIINNYTNCNFILVKDEEKLTEIDFTNSIILLQHLYFTNIQLDTIINIKKKYKCKLIISIHDWYWLNNKVMYEFDNCTSVHNNYLNNNIIINEDIKIIFKLADDIVHPSKFTYEIFEKYFENTNFKLVYHNDYLIDFSTKNIPLINNNTINIGIFHELSEYKGKEYIEILKKNYNKYNNYNIKWLIVGGNIPVYRDDEFFKYIKKYNIHCLLLLNKWGETWCYSLTKFINSGLPIIYNNIGSFKERIPENIEHYFKVFDSENDIDLNNLKAVFADALTYIINNNGKFSKINTNTKINFNKYYDTLFQKKNNKSFCNLFSTVS